MPGSGRFTSNYSNAIRADADGRLSRRVDEEQDQDPTFWLGRQTRGKMPAEFKHGPLPPVPGDLIAHVTAPVSDPRNEPHDAEWRKQRPLARGVLDYFPDALMEVAHTSWVGSQQHNPGEEMRWAKEKSADEADCILRHLKDRGTRDTDGERHSAKVAWRALAMLQRELEAEKN